MSNTYATWNPSDKSPSGTLSGGNLIFTSGSANWYTARSTISVTSGKWYWEVVCTTGVNFMIGIGTASSSVADGSVLGATDAFGWGYNGGGNKFNGGSSTGYGGPYTTLDVIGVALDISTGTVEMFKNNASQGVMYTGLSGPMFAMVSVNNSAITANFGATTLLYTPPSGYNAGLYTTSGGVTAFPHMSLLGVGR